ncbi:hypothetical protein AOLI_G00174780 [Acnodon oligacanthus]
MEECAEHSVSVAICAVAVLSNAAPHSYNNEESILESNGNVEDDLQGPVQSSPAEVLRHLMQVKMGNGFNLYRAKYRPDQYIQSMDPGYSADRGGLTLQDMLIEVREEEDDDDDDDDDDCL